MRIFQKPTFVELAIFGVSFVASLIKIIVANKDTSNSSFQSIKSPFKRLFEKFTLQMNTTIKISRQLLRMHSPSPMLIRKKHQKYTDNCELWISYIDFLALIKFSWGFLRYYQSPIFQIFAVHSIADWLQSLYWSDIIFHNGEVESNFFVTIC